LAFGCLKKIFFFPTECCGALAGDAILAWVTLGRLEAVLAAKSNYARVASGDAKAGHVKFIPAW